MPHRTPYSLTPSSSTSTSVSSSFVPYTALSPYRDPFSNSNSQDTTGGGSEAGESLTAPAATMIPTAELTDLGVLASLGSSLSSSRDERDLEQDHEHVSYTPIYPSYSSSFSNSSLELHESLLLAIRERQLQHQLLQQYQQEQRLQDLYQHQYQHLHQHQRATQPAFQPTSALLSGVAAGVASDYLYNPQVSSLEAQQVNGAPQVTEELQPQLQRQEEEDEDEEERSGQGQGQQQQQQQYQRSPSYSSARQQTLVHSALTTTTLDPQAAEAMTVIGSIEMAGSLSQHRNARMTPDVFVHAAISATHETESSPSSRPTILTSVSPAGADASTSTSAIHTAIGPATDPVLHGGASSTRMLLSSPHATLSVLGGYRYDGQWQDQYHDPDTQLRDRNQSLNRDQASMHDSESSQDISLLHTQDRARRVPEDNTLNTDYNAEWRSLNGRNPMLLLEQPLAIDQVEAQAQLGLASLPSQVGTVPSSVHGLELDGSSVQRYSHDFLSGLAQHHAAYAHGHTSPSYDAPAAAAVNMRAGQDDIDRELSLPLPPPSPLSFSYPTSSAIFNFAMGTQQPSDSYSTTSEINTTTRETLARVLTSFQDDNTTIANENRPSSPTSQAVPLIASASILEQDERDASLIMVSGFTAMPRALPRRRYATRDYSNGSVSSDDWLRHPDVVDAFASGATSSGTALENQENVPPPTRIDPLDDPLHAFSLGGLSAPTPVSAFVATETLRTPSDMHTLLQQPVPQNDLETAVTVEEQGRDLEHGMATMSLGSSSPLIAGNNTRDPSWTAGAIEPPRGLEAASSASATSPSGLETTTQRPRASTVSRSERLGLLGPLLSSTRSVSNTSTLTNTALASSSVPSSAWTPDSSTLDFALLGSTRHGLDSSIHSMASRIRQARLTRLLRLLSERESFAGYPGRYPWSTWSSGPGIGGDTTSMLNHASGSRTTSQTGSLDHDGLVDMSTETAVDRHEVMAAATLASATTLVAATAASFSGTHSTAPAVSTRRDGSQDTPTQFYPVHCPVFAEVLDCNGNSIEWGDISSHDSSSSSSIASYDVLEEREYEQDDEFGPDRYRAGTSPSSRPQRRHGHPSNQPASASSSTTGRKGRTRAERSRWEQHGIICGQRRTRVVSTGTVFEGMDHICESDAHLIGPESRYQSLKASAATNPNGESWSDEDEMGPLQQLRRRRRQRLRHAAAATQGTMGRTMMDLEDKDQELSPFVLRPRSNGQGAGSDGLSSLDILQSSLHYPFGMVDHHVVGPTASAMPGDGIVGRTGSRESGLYYIYSNVRNRYGPEGHEIRRRRRVLSEMSDLLRREQEWEREQEQLYRDMATNHRNRAQTPTWHPEENEPTTANGGNSSMPWSLPLNSENASAAIVSTSQHTGTRTTITEAGQESEIPIASSWQHGSDLRTDASMLTAGGTSVDEFQGYEQGHSDYHTQSITLQNQRQQTSRLHTSDQLQQEEQQHPSSQQLRSAMVAESSGPFQHLPMSRQPAVAMMNRTPPLLPAQPHVNEPIAHQIRRVHTSHIVGLQRRWEMQQQLQRQLNGGGQGGGGTFGSIQNPDLQANVPYVSTAAAAFVPSSSSTSLSHAQERYNSLATTEMETNLTMTTGIMDASNSTAVEAESSHVDLPSSSEALSLMGSAPLSTTLSAERLNQGSRDVTDGYEQGQGYASANANANDANAHSSQWQQQQSSQLRPWNLRSRGSNSLYVNFEGGTLRPEERWRRGDEEMIGR
ncbi:hypothetical protein EDD11_006846 [Mortierella claussenii]|nr:hypothetical protein EDD11_006846 [Mortierella claussenii]